MKAITLFLMAFGISISMGAQINYNFNTLTNPATGEGSITFYTEGTIKGYILTEQSVRGIPEQILSFQYYNPPSGGGGNILNFYKNSVIVGEPIILDSGEKLYVNGKSQFYGKVNIAETPSLGNLFQIGDNGSLHNFSLSLNGIRSTIGNDRSVFFANNSTTYYGLKDHNNSEIFKVSKDPTYGSFIHLPNLDSRIVIGDFGSYRFNENYKLVVKQGNAIVEGNFITEGKIGIGTANPDQKLTVKGKIHAEEVIVDLNVPPDYVFEKYFTGESNLDSSYKMLSLEEVEAFLRQNHHLPDVPSAEEFQRDGLKVSEMTSLLLQKIEELTLYTIEQEKRIKDLESNIRSKN